MSFRGHPSNGRPPRAKHHQQTLQVRLCFRQLQVPRGQQTYHETGFANMHLAASIRDRIYIHLVAFFLTTGDDS